MSTLAGWLSGIWFWDSGIPVSRTERGIRILGAVIHLSACIIFFRFWGVFAYLAGGWAVPALLGLLALTPAFLLHAVRPLWVAAAGHGLLAAFTLYLVLRLGFQVGTPFAFLGRAMPMALAGTAAWICATRIAALREGRAGG